MLKIFNKFMKIYAFRLAVVTIDYILLVPAAIFILVKQNI